MKQKDKVKMKTEIQLDLKTELITPTKALALLENNIKNRPLNERTVNGYAKQMTDGHWKGGTAEPIKISKTNVLLDGQHRLAAVVKYGRSVPFLIARNLDDEIFSVLDTGKKRSAGDALSVSGVTNAKVKAAGITSWFSLKNGKLLRERGNAHKFDIGINNQIVLEEYYKRTDFWDAISEESIRNYFSFSKVVTSSYIIGWRVLFDEISPEKSEEFMRLLCTGENLPKGNIVLLLRNILISVKTSDHIKLDSKYKTAVTIKAWNHFFQGTETKHLTFNPNNEKFPVVAGTEKLSEDPMVYVGL